MPNSIPQRDPIGDPFQGTVLGFQEKHFLATTHLPGTDLLASGDFVVRYAVRYLGRPHISIVPGLVALDYGDMLTGEAMWSFITEKSNLHPRADVVGYRNDGTDEMIVMKKLDLAQPIQPLVYASGTATEPIAAPVALIVPGQTNLPARLVKYLPIFESLAGWQSS